MRNVNFVKHEGLVYNVNVRGDNFGFDLDNGIVFLGGNQAFQFVLERLVVLFHSSKHFATVLGKETTSLRIYLSLSSLFVRINP